MSEWRSATLGELTENFDARRKPVKTAERRPGPYPYFGASGVIDSVDDFIYDGDYLLIAEDGENLRSRSTPIAFLARGKFWVNNHAHVVRGNNNTDTRFLSYLLAVTDIAGYLTGSTQPKLTRAAMDSIRVRVPSTGDQRAIAEVLGAFDEKTSANTLLCSTAEQYLRASYQDLAGNAATQPVLVETIVRRVTQQRSITKPELLPQGEFPVFDQSESGFLGYVNGDGYLDAHTSAPILYFGDHTCKLRISARSFFVGPNTIPFVGDRIPSLVLYCALQGLQEHEEYKRHWQGLMKKSIVIPAIEDCRTFERRHRSILGILHGAGVENERLLALRDALLPQLMSGKLRVKDAHKVLEDAGV
ncbi:restriction endonuclease subunit S [Pseudarthrobacter sp. ATCC 49987]|uniref:restriction endonuclease subunit S n=1 Tax=Pseudarthrobacter sp. ATCC 49987 TaxID=2698204 RepID=UPI00136BD0A4|nr:restriction endonuclease subunit S [Pseudarthrobacter sp. ATCC 49987]